MSTTSKSNAKITRPIASDLHPIVTGNYRIATPTIEEFNALITRCLRYRITGALIYGASCIGKTTEAPIPASGCGSSTRSRRLAPGSAAVLS